MSQDTPDVNVEITSWRLEKFDGDPPKFPGEKEPVAVIEGGAGLPTRFYENGILVKEIQNASD